MEGVLANVSPFGKQRYREMTDVLAGWPGTGEYDAGLERKANSVKGRKGGERYPTGHEMIAALKVEAETGVSGKIEMSDDGTAFVVRDEAGEEGYRLKVTGFPKKLSTLKKIRK